MKREWTAMELVSALAKFPDDMPISFEDADTQWEIRKFSINEIDGRIWFLPCDYDEMIK